jgi:hypothetical protein
VRPWFPSNTAKRKNGNPNMDGDVAFGTETGKEVDGSTYKRGTHIEA